MDYRFLGRTGLKVSQLCMGTQTFGWGADEPAAHRMASMFVDAGGNFLDTSNIYNEGQSETMLGNWLSLQPDRSRLVIATKVFFPVGDGPNDTGLTRKHIFTQVEGSLRRLQTDYIDLYQMHCWDASTPLDETLRALDDLVRAGKVRYIGASNHAAWLLTKALWISDKHSLARYDCIQPHYNLLNRAEVEPDLAALCLDQGIGMIPYSPLAGGFLTGKYTRETVPPDSRGAQNERIAGYRTEQNFRIVDALHEMGEQRGATVAQMALAWLLTQPFVTAPIVGANTVAQLEESLGAVDLRLTEDEMLRLDELTGVDRNWFRR